MMYVRGIKGYYWNFGVGGSVGRSENNLKGNSWAGLTWRVRSNQSILKEISPEYSLEGLMLRLKLQYFGHLMGRANSPEKTLMLGKIEGRRRRGDRGWNGWMASLTQWTWVWANSRRQWKTGKPGVLWSMVLQRVRHDWMTEQASRGARKATSWRGSDTQRLSEVPKARNGLCPSKPLRTRCCLSMEDEGESLAEGPAATLGNLGSTWMRGECTEVG